MNSEIIDARIITYLNNKKRVLTEFGGGVFCGCVIHGYFIYNNLLNVDCTYNFDSSGSALPMGRWLLTYVKKWFAPYCMPWINSILAIMLLSICCILLISLFAIEGKVIRCLFVAFVMSFPTVTATLSYSFMSYGYILAFLLAIFAVMLLFKEKIYYSILGAICLSCSLGIYQNYFSVAIVTVCIVLILKILSGERIRLKQLVFYGITFVLGFVMYYFITKLFLAIEGVQLSPMQGVDNLNRVGMGVLENLGNSIVVCYATFFNFLTSSAMKGGFTKILVFFMLGIAVITGALHIYKNKIYKNYFEILFLGIIVTVFIPIGSTVSLLLSPTADLHMLTRMYWALLLFLLVLIPVKFGKSILMCYMAMGGGALLLIWFIVLSQVAYFNIQYAQYKTFSIYGKICIDMQNISGNNLINKPVLFVGSLPMQQFLETNITNEYTKDMKGLESALIVVDEWALSSYFRNVFAIPLQYCNQEQREQVANSESVKAMPVYPNQGYIKIQDGILVIKLGDQL